MKRWLLPAVTAVIVGLLVWAFLPGRSAQRVAAPNEALAEEVQALRGEVGRLRAEGQPKVYLVPTPEPLAAAATAAPAASAPSEPQPERTPEQKQKDAAAALEVKFESEPIDAAWSVAMVREIREAMSNAAPAARVLQANCATSLCRVVLGHDAEDDQRGLMTQVAAAKPFREGVFYDYDQAPGALKTTLYVVRQGHSFRD